MFEYYVEKSGMLLELRQSRFKRDRHTRKGEGHPHDVCAIARDHAEMKRMLDILGWSVNTEWMVD